MNEPAMHHEPESLPYELCHRARLERDPSFDGRFFFAVTTTGIYCRPVCPARRALARNVRYFDSAASAAAAGFRPCLRCKPEQAPVNPDPGHRAVERALERIEAGALDEGSVAELALDLGVGERRLRRLFRSTLGASPVKVALHRRLLMARQMLEAGEVSVIDVAFAAGFNSLRRFNEAFKDAFDVSPTQLRLAGVESRSGQLTLRLGLRAPFDGVGLLRFLAARAIPGVESVVLQPGGGSYSRTFALGGSAGILTAYVQTECRDERPTLPIEIHFLRRASRLPNVLPLVEKIKHIFDLGFDPSWIEPFSDDEVLASAYARWPGIRVPGCLDPFELCVRAILGQQVTVAGATTLSGRVAERWGVPIGSDACVESRTPEPETPEPENSAEPEAQCADVGSNSASHSSQARPRLLFPTADVLIDQPLEEIGLPAQRAETLRRIAELAVEEPDLFAKNQELEVFEERLCAVPGIGPWTANYVAMRALRQRDAFLAGDLVLRKRMAADGKLPTAAQLDRLSDKWRPYRSYAAMLLWRS